MLHFGDTKCAVRSGSPLKSSLLDLWFSPNTAPLVQYGRVRGMSPSGRLEMQPTAISLAEKLVLVARVWGTYAIVLLALRRHPLPRAIEHLSIATPPRREWPVPLLSRAVTRSLRIGPWQPRCLTRSLVLFRLLRSQGSAPDLVIGLPSMAADWDAHAWVELDSRDVGPAPGRGAHEELVRYPGGERGVEVEA